MTFSHPKVSIVIPVYNGADFLAEAIDSALAQTYKNFEIIVVNDGSNDDGATERIALGYGDKISYYAKANGGVASALNTAIGQMSGDFFSWLSHDDLYLPQKLEREMEAFLSQGDAKTIVYSDFGVFTESPEKAVDVALRHIEPEQFRYWITIENALHGCTLLIPRAAFSAIGVFDESLRTTQDYDLWFRMAKEYRFVHIPEVLVKARNHAGQGSISMAGIALAECNALLTKFTSELTHAELANGSQCAYVVGYAHVTSSLWKRGFRKAARRSLRLTIENLPSAKASDRLAAISFLAKGSTLSTSHGFLMRVARKLLPLSVRQALRRRLGQTATQPVDELPGARSPVDAVRHLALKEKFSEVYDKNIFAGPESRSGAGSDLVQTEIIRREIPRIISQYGIDSILDAPCGDWCWMRKVDLGVKHYMGVDIVEQLIAINTKEFGRPGIEFLSADLSKDALPKVDLIFSRDCLVHLSYTDAMKILSNFKASGAKYLLTTTFADRSFNTDLGDGFWRPLNKQIAPFNFPKPLEIINEGCTEGNNEFTDKSLGLWRLQDITIG